MVKGIDSFKNWFQGYEEQYVIIGGTACDILMTNEELSFRTTKDIDLVLIVEALNADFGRKFWEYVKQAGSNIAARVLECLSSTGSVIPYQINTLR